VNRKQQIRIGLGLLLGGAIALLWSGILSGLLSFPGVIPTQGAIALPTPGISPQTTELRGVWLTNIDSDVLFSRKTLSRAIHRLNRMNLNTLYPTVWNWGYTLYPSTVMENAIDIAIDPHPGFEDRDMLQEVVKKGHKQDLAVIPWFEFGLMAPADSELAQLHPDWLTQRRDGTQIVMEGADPRVWLNPAHPEVQQLMVDLVTEIATNYEVDGIQFDDHLGMPVELGYDPYTVALYQQDHNGQSPPADYRNAAWMRWRAEHITALMEKMFHAIKAARPEAIVALSPNPKQFSYDTFLQDWWTWERQGLVEEMIIQVYRPDAERFIYELSQPEIAQVKAHIPLGIGILTGLRNRPVEMETIQEQVGLVRDYGLAGVSFFFYESLGDRDAEFLDLFPTQLPRPSLDDF
jgi:uncharacterized lipoprotein YddW (UPF0748 family)